MISFETAERRLREVVGNKRYRDERVIKPESFYYSDFVRYVFKGSPVYCTRSKERKVRGLNGRLLLDLK